MDRHNEEWLIVDGYNVLGVDQRLDGDPAHLEMERDRLIHELSEYQAIKGIHVILVFDAHLTDRRRTMENQANITVIYTGKEETADEYIEEFVRRYQGTNRTIYVATSDYLEQRLILGQGAYRISSRELLHEIHLIKQKLRKQIENGQKKAKPALRERLSSEIRQKLEKWRRKK